MGRIGEKELKEQIKSKEFSNVYFIWGEEGYLKEYYVKKMQEKIVDPAFADFNFHQFESKNSTMSDILQTAQMIPMMSEYSFILVHDYPFEKQASDLQELKEYFKDIPESAILVFWFDSIEIGYKKSRDGIITPDSSKWKSIEAAFAKAGCSVNLEKRSESDIAKLLVNSAKKRNCTLDMNNARYLIGISGNDIQTLFSELEKICAYCGEGEITREDIDKLAVKSLQAKVFDLSKFILAGNADSAFSVLNSLFSQKEQPIGILTVISSCYIDMYRVKCAKAANVNEYEIADYYSYKGRDFLIRNASRNCRNISFESLRNSIDILQSADKLMKSSSLDANIILEETVAKLLLLSRS